MLPMLLPMVLVAPPAAEPLGTLLARAREARNAGRLAEAIQAYDAMLAQVPSHETALLERAETLGWAGRYAEAKAGYLAFRSHFPAQALTADLALARLAAWQDHTAEALALLQPWVQHHQRQAVLDSATYLAWGGRLPESLALVRPWRQAHAEDREAALLEAKCLSWAGRNAEARAVYRQLLGQAPGDREALAGLARLSLWEGDPTGARQVLDGMPEAGRVHPESQLLLAQVEAAQGHPRAALARAEALATGGPAQREATELRDDLIRAQGPWVEFSADRTDTSEGLRTENPALRIQLPVGDGSLGLGLGSHRSDFQGLRRDPSEARVTFAYPLGTRLRASASLTRLGDVGGETAWGYALGLGFAPIPGLDLSLARERSLALFTPQAVTLRSVFLATDLGATWRFGQGRHALSAGLGQADVTSNLAGPDSSTTRRSRSASYEYRFPVTALDLRGGLMTRSFGYDPSLSLGFFAPESYHWNGAFGSATWRRGRVLELGLGLQAGRQTVNEAPGQFTWNYRLGITWRPGPWPVDLSGWWSQSLAGLPVTTTADPSAYREHTLGCSIRVRSRHRPW